MREAFSLVMKTHNCLRRTYVRTYVRMYVSSPQIDAHAFRSWAQRNESLLLMGMSTKTHTPTLKAWKVTVVWTDATMPPFNVNSIRFAPEIVLSFKRN